jgi:membrane protease YdiL (CAAX protease family)
MWVGLIGLSLLAIVILNFSGDAVPGDRFDGTVSYFILGLFSFAVMWWLRPATFAYFALPAFGWRIVIALVFMVNLIVVQIRGEDFSGLTTEKWIRGVIFLILVAVAEEIFSRGIVFGVLLRHGLTVAVIGSSLMFGLMHINTYIGNFDAWPAYWHVMSAAFFGIFACALMVLTRSIWMSIVLHGFSNAGLLLTSAEDVQAERDSNTSVEFFTGLLHPLPAFATFVIPSLIMFWIAAGMPLHSRLRQLAIKWKLIEVNQEQ